MFSEEAARRSINNCMGYLIQSLLDGWKASGHKKTGNPHGEGAGLENSVS